MTQRLLCGAAAAKHAGNGRENGIGWAVRADSHAAPYAEDGQGTMHEGETNDPLVTLFWTLTPVSQVRHPSWVPCPLSGQRGESQVGNCYLSGVRSQCAKREGCFAARDLGEKRLDQAVEVDDFVARSLNFRAPGVLNGKADARAAQP